MTIGRNDGAVRFCQPLKPETQCLPEAVVMGYVACHGPWGHAIAMADAIRDLMDSGRAVGICLSYPDLFGSGQEASELPDQQLEDAIVAQLAVVGALSRIAGTRLSAVKCQGELLLDVESDERIAQVVARAIYKFDPSITLACAVTSAGARVARDCGIVVVQETFSG